MRHTWDGIETVLWFNCKSNVGHCPVTVQREFNVSSNQKQSMHLQRLGPPWEKELNHFGIGSVMVRGV